MDKPQDLGRLLCLLAPDLLQNAFPAVLDVLKTPVERLEDSEEDVHVLVAVEVVPGPRERRVRLQFTIHVNKVGRPAILALLDNDRAGNGRKPATVRDRWDGWVFWGIGHVFLVGRANIWSRLLAPRSRTVFFLRARSATVAAWIKDSSKEI
jgi:hypothetical protein